MDVLIGVVIAFIIIVAGYVGYHASQQEPEVGGHDISLKLDVLGEDVKNIQPLKQVIIKSIS
ncbi:hypothetical protein [Nitrosopumilus sp.]|uniref:hypothetical protein n=1 Tax=Nitrosopumilus sp. TaxID=2024843 RepID=UPI003D14CBB8